MASGWFDRAAIELVRARSLFIKVSPTPANLSERRAVLHALGRYGQIEIFKKLSSPGTFICAPSTIEIATKLVETSPFSFKFVPECLHSIEAKSPMLTPSGLNPMSVASPILVHEVRDMSNTNHTKIRRLERSDLILTFTLHIYQSQSNYEHKKIIRLSPLHGPWPTAPGPAGNDQDFVYLALKEVVPEDKPKTGLCDWQTGGQLSGESMILRAKAALARSLHYHERLKRNSRMKQRAQIHYGSTLAAVENMDMLRKFAHDNSEEDTKEESHQGLSRPRTSSRLAWERRKETKTNSLANGVHYKLKKKLGESVGHCVFKSVFSKAAADVELPRDESSTQPTAAETKTQ